MTLSGSAVERSEIPTVRNSTRSRCMTLSGSAVSRQFVVC